MNIEKTIKKEMLYAQLFILIGIIAGIAALVFDFQRSLMLGITVGFLPTGIGTLIIYKYAGKKDKLRKNIELENEERNIFINTKSGHTAFWVSYWYVFAAVVLSYAVDFSLQQFLVVTLIFMPVVYFILVAVNHRKY